MVQRPVAGLLTSEHGHERPQLELVQFLAGLRTHRDPLLAGRTLADGLDEAEADRTAGSNGSMMALPRLPYTSNRRAIGGGSIAAMSTHARARG